MKTLEEIRKEVEKCADLRNASNRVKCLKRALITEIAGDKDFLLYYRIDCKRKLEVDLVLFPISVSAFILSLANFASMLGETISPSSQNATELWEVIVGLIILIFIVLEIIFVGYMAIKYLRYHKRYKVLDMVLQEILDNWEDLFNSN